MENESNDNQQRALTLTLDSTCLGWKSIVGGKGKWDLCCLTLITDHTVEGELILR